MREHVKKVLVFSLTYLPVVGGHEIAVDEITKRIDASDVEFHLIATRFNKDLPAYEQINNVHVYRIGFSRSGATLEDTYKLPLKLNKYLFPIMAWLKAKTLHTRHNFDAFWSIQANYAGFPTLFTSWSFPDVPMVLTLQEGSPVAYYKRRVGPLYPIYKKIFERADIVQAISKYLATFARGMGARGEVVIVPNGVDVKKFARKPRTDELQPLLDKLGKKKNERYLITTSRLVEKNGVDDIIQALALLPEQYKLIVAGSGPLGESLWELVDELGIRDRVLFTGDVSHDELVFYYHASDVFVRPSRSEGFGNSFIEAMAAGLPVIATAVGGIPDFLTPPESDIGAQIPTGLFCEVHNPASIAEQVERLYEDRKLRNNIIENARAMVKKRYDWDVIASHMKQRVFDPAFALREEYKQEMS